MLIFDPIDLRSRVRVAMHSRVPKRTVDQPLRFDQRWLLHNYMPSQINTDFFESVGRKRVGWYVPEEVSHMKTPFRGLYKSLATLAPFA